MAGKVGLASSFTAASNQFLRIASTPALELANFDWTVAIWAKIDNKNEWWNPITKWRFTGVGNTDTGWRVEYDKTADRWHFHVAQDADGSPATFVAASSFGSPTVGEWQLIVVDHDAANNLIGIRINGGTKNTAAWSAGVHPAPTAALVIGGYDSASGTAYMDGDVDETAIWHRLLTDQEVEWLWSNGSGTDYAGLCGEFSSMSSSTSSISSSSTSSVSSSSTSTLSSSSTSSQSSSSSSSSSSLSSTSGLGLFPASVGVIKVGPTTVGVNRLGPYTAGVRRLGPASVGTRRKSDDR